MHIVIVERHANDPDVTARATFRQLKSINFSPEVDMTLATIPVNEFQAELVADAFTWRGNSYGVRLYDETAADYAAGSTIRYSDTTGLYADYDISDVRKVARNVYKITALSSLAKLDRYTLKSVHFRNVTFYQMVNSYLGGTMYKSGDEQRVFFDIASSLQNKHITGYFPEQTARERLQMICLSVGALVLQTGKAGLRIVPLETSGTPVLIPFENTYYKPEIENEQPTRTFSITSYDDWTYYTEEPSGGDYVYDEFGELYWTYSKYQSFTYALNAEGNDITIDGVMSINNTLAVDAMGVLKEFYKYTDKITFEAINNGEYWPGDKVYVYLDDETVYTGYIASCDFSFGNQNKAKITLMLSVNATSEFIYTVNVEYIHHFTDDAGTAKTITLGRNEYHFIDGSYTIRHPDIYVDVGPSVRIFQPAARTSSVTINGEGVDITVSYT